MRANERTDKQVAQYSRLDSWLIRTTVHTREKQRLALGWHVFEDELELFGKCGVVVEEPVRFVHHQDLDSLQMETLGTKWAKGEKRGCNATVLERVFTFFVTVRELTQVVSSPL